MTYYDLIVLLYLLYIRIKETPHMLNEKKYSDWLKEKYDEVDKSLKDIAVFGNNAVDIIKKATLVFELMYLLFLISFYFCFGLEAGNLIFAVLSSFEIANLIVNFKIQFIDERFLDFNVDNHKFHKEWFAFNVILDYAYLFMAFYLLLLK